MIKFYANGTPRYESARATKRTEAKRLLREREGRFARGEPVLPRVDRIRYEEVAAELRRHYLQGAVDIAYTFGWRVRSEVLALQLRQIDRGGGTITPWPFSHLSGPHKGKRIRDFRKAWKTACRKAGVPWCRSDRLRRATRMVTARVSG